MESKSRERDDKYSKPRHIDLGCRGEDWIGFRRQFVREPVFLDIKYKT
jgi:hypothetical protein